MLDSVLKALQNLSILELSVFIIGFVNVFLLIKEHVGVYPGTIISSFLHIFIIYSSQIYAGIVIDIYFIVSSVYGWMYWKSQNDASNDEFAPSKGTFKQNLVWFAAFLLIWLILLIIFKYLLKSDFSELDTCITSAGFVATYLMIKKKIENWVYWLFGVFITLPMYYYKHLYLLCILYLAMVVLNIIGLKQWTARLVKSQYA
ncbi:nicotinamide riboside transporter PnuC [Solitalea sp. MAHUQ-68]|uniref:Nicotinamide riboside transporter PnuC n=1 Tax=Solitalea agri TaxID=2953739 RepID=A0A9X2FBD0_9SPHI|nr:nicotinamide riboside transporter PnuC [Solitalea agri]MCO4293773.1 nicotinamide riboside transporter PnuC [Solitalea agri]